MHFIGVKTNLNYNGTWARVVLLNSTSLYKISSVTFDKSSVLTDDNNQGKISLSCPGCFIFMIRLLHCYFISISKFQPFSCQMSTLTSSLQQRYFKCHLDAKQFLLDLVTIWFVNSRNIVGNGQEPSFPFQNDGKVCGLYRFWLHL